MQRKQTVDWVVADFFTHNYRISGRVSTKQRKLASQLNDQSTAFVQIDEAYVSNIQQPAEIATSHSASILYKCNITAVVVARREDGLPRELSYGTYLDAYMGRTFLTIPSFEVEGDLRLSSKLDLRMVLTSGTDDFVIVLDGRMKSAVRPDVTFSGGAILVNKDHIGAFCLEDTEI
jgi:hypothetical protein